MKVTPIPFHRFHPEILIFNTILPASIMYVSVGRNDCDGGRPVGTLAQIFSFAMFWLGVLDRRVSWY